MTVFVHGRPLKRDYRKFRIKTLEKQDDIDISYYRKLVDDAKDTISKYGDFEAFVT